MTQSRNSSSVAGEVRANLVELGGRTAQDLGFSRIAGQILVSLYLTDGDCPLDKIEEDLGLSKASVSIAARQLESMGLLKRSWHQGDRRCFYRTADNLGDVFRDGVVALVRRKAESITLELEQTHTSLNEAGSGSHHDVKFLKSRIKRAKDLSDRANKILNSRILRYFAR